MAVCAEPICDTPICYTLCTYEINTSYVLNEEYTNKILSNTIFIFEFISQIKQEHITNIDVCSELYSTLDFDLSSLYSVDSSNIILTIDNINYIMSIDTIIVVVSENISTLIVYPVISVEYSSISSLNVNADLDVDFISLLDNIIIMNSANCIRVNFDENIVLELTTNLTSNKYLIYDIVRGVISLDDDFSIELLVGCYSSYVLLPEILADIRVVPIFPVEYFGATTLIDCSYSLNIDYTSLLNLSLNVNCENLMGVNSNVEFTLFDDFYITINVGSWIVDSREYVWTLNTIEIEWTPVARVSTFTVDNRTNTWLVDEKTQQWSSDAQVLTWTLDDKENMWEVDS